MRKGNVRAAPMTLQRQAVDAYIYSAQMQAQSAPVHDHNRHSDPQCQLLLTMGVSDESQSSRGLTFVECIGFVPGAAYHLGLDVPAQGVPRPKAITPEGILLRIANIRDMTGLDQIVGFPAVRRHGWTPFIRAVRAFTRFWPHALSAPPSLPELGALFTRQSLFNLFLAGKASSVSEAMGHVGGTIYDSASTHCSTSTSDTGDDSAGTFDWPGCPGGHDDPHRDPFAPPAGGWGDPGAEPPAGGDDPPSGGDDPGSDYPGLDPEQEEMLCALGMLDCDEGGRDSGDDTGGDPDSGGGDSEDTEDSDGDSGDSGETGETGVSGRNCGCEPWECIC